MRCACNTIEMSIMLHLPLFVIECNAYCYNLTSYWIVSIFLPSVTFTRLREHYLGSLFLAQKEQFRGSDGKRMVEKQSNGTQA